LIPTLRSKVSRGKERAGDNFKGPPNMIVCYYIEVKNVKDREALNEILGDHYPYYDATEVCPFLLGKKTLEEIEIEMENK
jgi:hypothetical protein